MANGVASPGQPESAPAQTGIGDTVTATASIPRRSVPVGTILLLALAGAFYIWLMIDITGPAGGSGEALIEQAFESLFLTLFLWVALALLLIAGGVIGEMPRWVAMLAVFVHPLSGVGTFVAIDMVSRHSALALLVPGLLPLLIAFYAMWARCASLRRIFPPRITSILVWSAILVLAIVPLPVSYWGPATFGE